MDVSITKPLTKPEILAPAGNMNCLKAAVAAGCDAVYFGGRDFSARNLADNFSDDEISEAIDYCHLRGVKAYITVNTVYLDTELADLFEFIGKCYAEGADAFIFQDIGAAAEAKKLFPGIVLHASTQMTAQSAEDVNYLHSLGFSRIVLARELSIEEIKEIRGKTDAELEVFVHGALCVSYSGQCLMSSFIGRRSGNRGRCAQPCRQKYQLIRNGEVSDIGYILSPKDMMTGPVLKEIAQTSVNALKIEGRMKSAEYVAQTVRSYREFLENPKPELKENSRKLAQAFNRGGFTTGYFKNHAGSSMISKASPKPIGTYFGKVMGYDPRREICKIFAEGPVKAGDGIEIWTKREPHTGTNININSTGGEMIEVSVKGEISTGDLVYKSYDKALMDELKKYQETDTKKIQIGGEYHVSANKPAYLKLSYGGITVEKEGEVVSKAQSRPATKEQIETQLSKMGNTPFVVLFDGKSSLDEDVFISVGGLNAVRRDAAEELTDEIVWSSKKKLTAKLFKPPLNSSAKTKPQFSAFVRNREQFKGILAAEAVTRIYVEASSAFITGIEFYISECEKAKVELYTALPSVWDETAQDFFAELEGTKVEGYLIRNYAGLLATEKTEKSIALDYTFNDINILTHEFLKMRAKTVCLSPESNMEAIKILAGETTEMIIHGNITLMTTKNCPVGNFAGERENGKFCMLKNKDSSYYLKDKTGVKFPVITNCASCIAYIFNEKPLFMLAKIPELKTTGAGLLRLQMSVENMAEAYQTACAYKDMSNGILDSKEAAALTERVAETGFTYGYFFSEFAGDK